MNPILVPQKLSVAKLSVPLHNFPFREHREISVASLANNSARRLTKPWTLTYSSHFTSEAKKDKREHVLKKLNPVQYVCNLLPFVFQIEESEKIYCSGIIKYQNDVINRNIKIGVATPFS
jgi:hypothetical protein